MPCDVKANGGTQLGAWAKINELDYVGGKWANEIMSAVGMKYTFTIPTGVASGEYLLRSEMLALHASQTVGGAQVCESTYDTIFH